MLWTILGISVAIVAVFCISVAETFVGQPLFESHRAHTAVGFALAGGLAWIVGRYISTRDPETAARRYILADLRYWGPMLLLLGVITLFIRPLRVAEAPNAPVAIVKPPAPKPVLASVIVEKKPEPARPVVFPKLKVQGIIFRDTESFVILNGESYATGEQVGDVIVREINRDNVLVELAGTTKTLKVD